MTVRWPIRLARQTRSLVFAIPAQPGANEATLTYRVRAERRRAAGRRHESRRAIAEDGTSVERGARARARVERRFHAAGMPYRQSVRRRQRQQDPGSREPGVAGVALYLEDGTSLLTDSAGSFSYCGVRAGTHVLKVDTRDFAGGCTLVAPATATRSTPAARSWTSSSAKSIASTRSPSATPDARRDRAPECVVARGRAERGIGAGTSTCAIPDERAAALRRRACAADQHDFAGSRPESDARCRRRSKGSSRSPRSIARRRLNAQATSSTKNCAASLDRSTTERRGGRPGRDVPAGTRSSATTGCPCRSIPSGRIAARCSAISSRTRSIRFTATPARSVSTRRHRAASMPRSSAAGVHVVRRPGDDDPRNARQRSRHVRADADRRSAPVREAERRASTSSRRATR